MDKLTGRQFFLTKNLKIEENKLQKKMKKKIKKRG